MQLSHTKHSGLTLHNIVGFNGTLNRYVSVWKHRTMDGATVGPSYPTQAEALADSFDYACRAGWLQQFGH